jgi:hypothetical protein
MGLERFADKAYLALLTLLLIWALVEDQNIRDEIAAGSRWYVAVPGSRELQDVYIYDITDKTVELLYDDESRVRFALKDVDLVEQVEY